MPPVFDHALAAVDYELPWSPLVAALKFQQDPALARPLARMLAQSVKARWTVPAQPETAGSATLDRASATPPPLNWRRGAPSLIVPVPLSAKRLAERGYNQAWLLADQLGKQLVRPTLSDALIRTQHTERLMSMDASERQDRISGAFAVNPRHRRAIKDCHVAVVDDVLTTGATLNEVARTLWLAGAREISVWVVARTPLPDSTTQPPSGDQEPGQSNAWPDTLAMA